MVRCCEKKSVQIAVRSLLAVESGCRETRLLFSYHCMRCVCIIMHEEDRKSLVKCSKNLGPVVESVVSLTSSLVVKMLTILVSTISNSQVFLLKKCA